MNLKQLRVFLGVVDAGSFSAAAEWLHLSQSVISRHVQSLEETLGCVLMDRLPRGIETTEVGAALADHARHLFALEREAEATVQDLVGLRSGTLRLGASMTIGNYLLPKMLTTYHQRYPEVNIELSIANTQSVQRDLTDRRIDMGLTEGFIDDESFAVRVFANDQLVPVTAADTTLARKGGLSLRELVRHPCVVREPGSGTRAVVEQALAERGLKLRQVMALSSAEAAKQAVIAGAGFTFASVHAVHTELATGQLVRLRPDNFCLRRPLHLLQLRHKHPTQAVTAFTAQLDRWIADVVAAL